MGQTFELEDHRPRLSDRADSELVAAYMDELDQMRSTVTNFANSDPADVLTAISGISGRLAEIRAMLQRSSSQRATALRTKEVDPLREELDLQFRVWSRKIALMEWELRMSGGGI